ncbi:amino acid ABC transporter ATP-binding protein [Actinoplanes derwentensis]|uniref:Polar amino acid transport system ATP-binding protein n=1 Tax=Actinoplanes derwentensis TaxID=113562 RepID=A0A1H2D8F1_9ACTN|nr:amino acid ABC transporter ATP-binding protein [Actinoplanes derwentensis]GID89714.1 glutamate ABC transporter ATP-binding protein [Actinoplanes derwentensis]SDT78869.1 polar amino acid transport system ATP-binding protein [Actinoplanes derwentensis]
MSATAGPLAVASGEPGPMVRLIGISKSFGGVTVLDGVDLSVAAGTVTCVVGPSGSGKSTLLRCVNRLERPDSGAILVDGRPVGLERRGDRVVEASPRVLARHRTSVGMVFQALNLFPHLTVLQNIVESPVAVQRVRRDEARARARELLDRVGLAHKERAYPRELSGGEQQRVAIARALAVRPKVMLFDEPTSALDPELIGEVLTVVRDLAAGGMTMLIVTHELRFAAEVADEIVFMDQGRIVEQGPPAAMLGRPRHERTARFFATIQQR